MEFYNEKVLTIDKETETNWSGQNSPFINAKHQLCTIYGLEISHNLNQIDYFFENEIDVKLKYHHC